MRQARATTLLGLLRPRPLRPRMSAGEAVQRCQAAMTAVAQTQLRAHVSSTVDRRQKCPVEAEAFLETLPKGWAATLETAGPEHVLWFAQDE